MNVNNLFPSRYIRGEDVGDKEYTLTIRNVTMEKMGREQEENPVVWFSNAEKGMVLKKTNAMTIADLYGPETSSWTGKRITITSRRIKIGGSMQSSIVVSKQIPPPPPGPAVQPTETKVKAPAMTEEARERRKKIVEMSQQHDSFFMENSDTTTLKELMMAEDGIEQDAMPTVPAAGKSISMYHYLLQKIDKYVGVDGVAEDILTYLLSRVVSADTPPTMGAKGILLDDLMSDEPAWSDALVACWYLVQEHMGQEA